MSTPSSTKKIIIILLFSVVAIVLFMYRGEFMSFDVEFTEVPAADSTFTVESKSLMYGIETDSFTVETQQVKRKEFLADILLAYNVSYSQIHHIASFSKDIFNVRNIRVGDWYTVISNKDSIPQVQYFVYQPNAIEYIVCDLRDSVNIYRDKKEVTIKVRTTQGVINSSLYETLMENNSSPMLAMDLSTIYAWTIDFYGIQKGDFLKVIYEEKYVDDKKVGLGKVLSAQFNHYGKDFFAVYFEKDTIKGYYDDKGVSMRKAFLKSPLKYSRISSSFTHRRFHPVQKKWKAHLGTDYAAPRGTPILSTGDGVVVEARYKSANGNYVKIKHNSIYYSQYLHMSKRARGMKPGRRVHQGEVIGYVGSTGLATGPHVCYRFWKNGSQVNHLREIFPPVDSLSGDFLKNFFAIQAQQVKELEQLKMLD